MHKAAELHVAGSIGGLVGVAVQLMMAAAAGI
jgi:hypothetical protein